MARVTGIGGVFLRSKDPKALAKWYSDHLGITVNNGYAAFPWSDEGPAGTGMTTGSAPAMPEAKANPWYPDHAVFSATKDQLKAMPEFKYSTE